MRWVQLGLGGGDADGAFLGLAAGCLGFARIAQLQRIAFLVEAIGFRDLFGEGFDFGFGFQVCDGKAGDDDIVMGIQKVQKLNLGFILYFQNVEPVRYVPALAVPADDGAFAIAAGGTEHAVAAPPPRRDGLVGACKPTLGECECHVMCYQPSCEGFNLMLNR